MGGLSDSLFLMAIAWLAFRSLAGIIMLSACAAIVVGLTIFIVKRQRGRASRRSQPFPQAQVLAPTLSLPTSPFGPPMAQPVAPLLQVEPRLVQPVPEPAPQSSPFGPPMSQPATPAVPVEPYLLPPGTASSTSVSGNMS